MNIKIVLRLIIIIFIIIGGVLIFFPPKPEPICIVCGENFSRIAGVINVLLGIGGLAALGKLKEAGYK